MAELTFVGTADAFNSAGRGHSCYWVEDSLGCFMVDFGPTALMRCQQLNMDLSKLDGVYVTHLHGDHIGGLAMLLVHCAYKEERTRPFTVAGPPGLEGRLNALWESAYPSVIRRGLPFPLLVRTWDVPSETEVMGRMVKTMRAQHDRYAIATSLRIEADGYSLAFSGDTGWHAGIPAFVEDVDLFICECTETDEGFWGHMSLEELIRHRSSLNVGQLLLSHLSDDSREAATVVAEKLDATVADDGLVLQLD